MMGLWRIEEDSISHLVCTLCIPEVFWRTFVKQMSLYHVIHLIKIQGVLRLWMDLWITPGASFVLDKVWRSTTVIFDEWKKPSLELLEGKTLKIFISGTYLSSKDPGGKFWFQLQISKIWVWLDFGKALEPLFDLQEAQGRGRPQTWLLNTLLEGEIVRILNDAWGVGGDVRMLYLW